MGPKRNYDLDEAMDLINDWIDNDEDDNDGDATDDLQLLNGDDQEDDEEIEEEYDEVIEHPFRHRRILTKCRKVNSIDNALNPDNYQDIYYVNGHGQWDSLTGFLGPKSQTNTEKIEWCSDPPQYSGRQRSCDVIRGPCGVLRSSMTIDTELDAWNLVFDDVMIDTMVENTNNKMKKKINDIKKTDTYKKSPNKYTWLQDIDIDRLEMRAVIGLIYARGLLGQTFHKIDLLFGDYGHYIFGATISKNRLKFVLSNICFESLQNAMRNFPTDRFASCRTFWERFNKNISKHVDPSEYMTIDETLYPMRHQIAFKQYNPKKPHKYGLLFKSLNDARFPYTYKSVPYAGKPTSGDGPYYINSTIEYVKYLVNETQMDVSLKGRCIATDRLYTSIEQANWMLEKGITNLGTMDTKRIGIPDELKNAKSRPVFSATKHFEKKNKNLCLNTYTVKTKSKGTKNVLMLTSLRPLDKMTIDDEKNKPAIFKLYDFTKGGTDIVDQLNDYYSTRTKTRHWAFIVLFYALDTSRVNAKTIYCLSKGLDPRKYDSFKFGWELMLQLVKPFAKNRKRHGLQMVVQNKIELLLGKEETVIVDNDQTMKKRKRCDIHIEAAKTAIERRNAPKSIKKCDDCGSNVCGKCYKLTCRKCSI